MAAYPANAYVAFDGQYTDFGLADFLVGEASTFVQGAGETQNQTGVVLGIYGQDEWKVNSNFTVTAGLRWEPNLPPTVKNGRGAAFIPGQQSTRYPNAPLGLVFPGDKGMDASLLPHDYKQFGPRIGLAWQPRLLPNTAIRAAFGIFFAPLEYSVYNHTADISPFSPTYTFNGTSAANGFIPLADPYSVYQGTNFTNPFPPFASAGYNPPATATFPAGVVSVGAVFSRDFKIGTTQSWNLSVEKQFGAYFAMHLAYVGSESYHQVLPLDLNPGAPGTGIRTKYTNFANILQNSSIGTANYNSLQVGVEKKLSHNLQFQSNFTWARTEDTFTGNSISFGNALADPYDIRHNFGRSDLNIPYISVSNFVYTTPMLAGRNAFVRQGLGGWEVSGIYTLQSGLPFSIYGGNNNSGSNEYGDRADFAPGYQIGRDFGVHKGGKSQWLAEYFNPNAFVPNRVGTFGDTPRNFLQGPGVNTGDFGLMKNWSYRERYRLQFRWEMFNAFNHANFANPNTNSSSGANFGRITNIGSVAPRVQQAALKLTF